MTNPDPDRMMTHYVGDSCPGGHREHEHSWEYLYQYRYEDKKLSRRGGGRRWGSVDVFRCTICGIMEYR